MLLRSTTVRKIFGTPSRLTVYVPQVNAELAVGAAASFLDEVRQVRALILRYKLGDEL